MKNKIEELNEKITKLNKELTPLRIALREAEDKKLADKFRKNIGKCFVYRKNCYSDSRIESDYWDMFMRIISVTKDAYIYFEISKDSYGRVSFEIGSEPITFGLRAMWKPVSEAEYLTHLKELVKEMPELEVKKYVSEKPTR